MTRGLSALLLVWLVAPGCVTPRLLEWRKPKDLEAQGGRPRPEALVRAARTPSGVIHLETRFRAQGEVVGSVRHYVLDPAGGQAAPRETWPSAAGRLIEAEGRLKLRPSGAPWPDDGVPVAIVRASGGEASADEPPAFALRLRGARLEMSDGGGRFRDVAGYPTPGAPARREGRPPFATFGVALLLPMALVVDTGLIALGIATIPLWAPGALF